jgi:hypothetical protein
LVDDVIKIDVRQLRTTHDLVDGGRAKIHVQGDV